MKTYYDGKLTCIATHPNEANMNKNSRGRKLHLLKNDGSEKTICNLLFSHNEDITKSLNSRCKVCFKDGFEVNKISKP